MEDCEGWTLLADSTRLIGQSFAAECSAFQNHLVRKFQKSMSFDHLNTVGDWPEEPISLFREWFDLVEKQNVPEPEAMALASSTKQGVPSVRVVLLRGFDDRGFCFFTNYESRKGQELIANPVAAATFYWRDPYLQVRIEGRVEKQSAEESDAYFNSRPRANRASSFVSNQSRAIDDFRSLRQAADQLLQTDEAAMRPDHWGGFRIVPVKMEFWAGSQDRMHRRCEYSQTEDGWDKILLAP